MAAPILAPLVRWFLLGAVASIGWRIASYALDKLGEDEWIASEVDECLTDLKHTWTGRSGPEQGAPPEEA